MCEPGTLALIATAASVAGTITSSLGAYQQKRYEAKVAEANQAQENAKVVDALNRGDITARDTARKQAQLAGAQRASMAANGIDLSFGSAADLLGDTAMFGREEQMTVRENTRREVMGYDINAANFGGQARAARAAGTGILISGALQSVATIAGGAQRMGKISADRSAGLSGWGG